MRTVLSLLLCLPACGKSEAPAPSPAKTEAKQPASEAEAAPEKAPPRMGGRPMMPASHPSFATAPRGAPREVTPSGKTRAEVVDELGFSVPEEWEPRPLTSNMRKAAFALPGPGGDAELVVYRFKGGAGSVDANLTRWKGQMQDASNEKTDEHDIGNLTLTVLSLDGTYVGSVRPGSLERHDQPSSRLVAAVVEGSGDPLFVKLVGAAATLDVWADAITASLKSFAASAAPGKAPEKAPGR